MLDYHCHILPNIDDGPTDMEEAVEMAAALQKAGFTGIYCTPHLIKGSYEADNNDVKKTLAELQKRLRAKKIEIKLIPGREYYLDEYLFDYLEDPLPLGDTNYIMVEIPNYIPRKVAKETCFRLRRKGFIPMIAHPERNKLFFTRRNSNAAFVPFLDLLSGADDLKPWERSILSYLRNIGCAFQGNLGSFAGWYGAQAQQAAETMKERNAYTHFGTDVHSLKAVKLLTENGKKK